MEYSQAARYVLAVAALTGVGSARGRTLPLTKVIDIDKAAEASARKEKRTMAGCC